MASFKVYYDKEEACLISSFEGKASFETVKEYVRKILETGDKYQCKALLNDLRRAELAFSVDDLTKIMELLTRMVFDKSWKRAIVVNKKLLEYRFYEALLLNEAIDLKIFTNPYEALIWLKKSD